MRCRIREGVSRAVPRLLLALLGLPVLLFAGTPLTAHAQAAQTPIVVTESQVDRDAHELNTQLRCPVCQGESIQDSPSPVAKEMREVVREQLEAGKSRDEVKAYFVSRYGEFVLMRPEAHGWNLLVYVLPVLVVFGGGWYVYRTARRWTQTAQPDEVG